MRNEKQRVYEKEYKRRKRLDPAFVQMESSFKREWRHKHPDKALAQGRALYEKQKGKHKARNRVKDLVKSGRIIKPSVCPSCKKKCKPLDMHAHHPNHDAREAVAWLCRQCHAKEHTNAKG